MNFKPLSKAEYEIERNKEINSYVNELFVSGTLTKEKAQKQAEATFNKLLPNGIDTKGNYLCYAFDHETFVGFIWYAILNNKAFIYDFYVDESMRRKGYGKQIINACKKDAKSKGANEINLHVFGHNKPARALYLSLGYNPVSIEMKKKLN